VDQLENRGLSVQRIQQQNVEKATAIQIGQAGEQSQRSRIFALTPPNPLDGEERLDGTMDHLAADGAMVILRLLDLAAGLILQGHLARQATLTVATETGHHLDAVQSRHQVALYLSLIEGFAALQATVDIHQHGFQRLQVEATQTVP
jgi:hypothetical protein